MTALLGSLTLIASGLPIGVAWVGKAIIDAVVDQNTGDVLRFVGVELGLVVTLALAQRAIGLLWQLLGARLSIDINVMILEKARELSLTHFEDPTFYDQLTRARREASSRPLSVVTGTFGLIQSTLTLLGYLGLLLDFSVLAAVGLLLAAVPAAIMEMRFSNQAFRLRNWRAPESRRLNYYEYVLANDKHAKEIMLFGLGHWFLDRYRGLAESMFS